MKIINIEYQGGVYQENVRAAHFTFEFEGSKHGYGYVELSKDSQGWYVYEIGYCATAAERQLVYDDKLAEYMPISDYIEKLEQLAQQYADEVLELCLNDKKSRLLLLLEVE
jgi:hypothetical protein